MKSKVIHLLLITFLLPTIALADSLCKQDDGCVRIYVATGQVFYGDSRLQGVEFPVYLGFFTINPKQNKFFFTKKTLYDFSEVLNRYKGIIESGIFVYGMLGKPDGKLEKYFDKATVESLRNDRKIQPKNYGAYLYLPQAILERGGLVKALGYSEDSSGVDPESVDVQFFKQCTYLPNNDPPERCDREEENAFFMMVPNLKITPYEVDINRYKRYLETGEID